MRLAFDISWRLAILVLPWQTRWFVGASLGGWPWEQGRWSVYVSMFFVFATIVFGGAFSFTKGNVKKSLGRWIFPILIVLTFWTTLSRTATAQWWIEVLLLSGFVWTLWKRNVSQQNILGWFTVGLLPSAVLAVRQYITGNVVGSTWLGIAAHAAKDLGTSVVQHGDVRILRAYGSFPHPNILGGWAVVGVVAALSLAAAASTKARTLWWSAAAALLGIVLVVSYARSAWIAAIFGVIVWTVIFFQKTRMPSDHALSRQYGLIALIALITVGGAVIFSQRDHILSRADFSHRLEAQSINMRGQSLVDGWNIFQARPFFGAGPNAELVALDAGQNHGKSEQLFAPLEPPHNVFLLALADLGVVGILLLLISVWPIFRAMNIQYIPFWGSLLILASFDHYLWSTWSGMCLVAIVLLISYRRSFIYP